MSSVLIKGMEMPKSCSKCGWFDMGGGYGYQCTLSHKSFDMWNKISVARDKNCPLVEIPTPHGRLVDVDDFMRHLISNVADLRTLSTSTVGKALHDTPTIVEAEGSEE